MKVGGLGSLTQKGLQIITFCLGNGAPLQFKKFFATNKIVDFNILGNPADTIYAEMTREQLLTHLSASEYYEGNICKGEPILSSGYAILPVLLPLISNDYSKDIEISSIFMTSDDPNGIKILPTLTGIPFITIPQTVTFGAPISGYSGKLFAIEGGTELYIKELQDSFGASITFEQFKTLIGSSIVGITGSIEGSASFKIDDCSELEMVMYKCCGAYEEVIDIELVDASAFSVGGYISNNKGAIGYILGKTGNILNVVRKNVYQFNDGDEVDNVETYFSAKTTINGTPILNITMSSVLPITYIADGASILIRVNLRHTSEWPKNLLFLNSAVVEIEIHNSDENDSHLDLRMQDIVNFSLLGADVRKLFERVDAIRDQLNKYRMDNDWIGTPFI